MTSEPVVYFFLHSGIFVAVTGALFFTLGLWFGHLTWGRHKRRARSLTAEIHEMKNEMAALKRKIAELTAKLSLASQSKDEAASDQPPAATDKPDPTIGSLIARATTILSEPSWPISASTSEKKPDELSESSLPSDLPAKPAADEAAAGESPTRSGPLAAIAKKAAKKAASAAAEPLLATETEGGARKTENESPAKSSESDGRGPAEATPAEPAPPELAAADGGQPPAESRLISDPLLGLVYTAAPASSDDLAQIKGVASVLAGRLNEFGIHTYKQIALWSDENVREFSRLLAAKDRINREMWVEQSRELHFQKYGERV